jgi:hypothetical protein
MINFAYTNSFYIIGSLLTLIVLLDATLVGRRTFEQIVAMRRTNSVVGNSMLFFTLFFTGVVLYLNWNHTMQIWMAVYTVCARGTGLAILAYSEYVQRTGKDDEDTKALQFIANLANGRQVSIT